MGRRLDNWGIRQKKKTAPHTPPTDTHDPRTFLDTPAYILMTCSGRCSSVLHSSCTPSVAMPSISLLSDTTDKRLRVPRRPLVDSLSTGEATAAPEPAPATMAAPAALAALEGLSLGLEREKRLRNLRAVGGGGEWAEGVRNGSKIWSERGSHTHGALACAYQHVGGSPHAPRPLEDQSHATQGMQLGASSRIRSPHTHMLKVKWEGVGGCEAIQTTRKKALRKRKLPIAGLKPILRG